MKEKDLSKLTAVALEYNPDEDAPKVVASGKGALAQKILEKGDVLKSADFNKDYFTQIDIRTTKEIKLYSKRAELLTTHPAKSYELVKDDKGQLTLKITNPKEFWSVSKYLVIQVK